MRATSWAWDGGRPWPRFMVGSGVFVRGEPRVLMHDRHGMDSPRFLDRTGHGVDTGPYPRPQVFGGIARMSALSRAELLGLRNFSTCVHVCTPHRPPEHPRRGPQTYAHSTMSIIKKKIQEEGSRLSSETVRLLFTVCTST